MLPYSYNMRITAIIFGLFILINQCESADLISIPATIQTSTYNAKNSSASTLANDSPPEILTLKMAVDRSMANNQDLKENKLALRTSELTYDDAWDQMYMPKISLILNSNAAQTLGSLPGATGGTADYNHGYPSSSAEVALGQYTLYNFGRDKLVFDQAKLQWKRDQETYEEQKRTIRFSVVNAFWTLKSHIDKLNAFERSVEIADAIVKLQESRVFLQKANWTDVSSSTVDLVATKNLRDQANTDVQSALYALNVLLGDPVGHRYQIDEEIVFLPIKVTEEILYQTYLAESPDTKTSLMNFLKSQLALELTEKNLLPLPTIKFSGVTVGYGNNYYGGAMGTYTQGPGVNNFDISAGINLTVPLTGPGGLFGSRTVELSQIQRETSEVHIGNVANKGRQSIFQIVQNIRQFERTVENNKQGYKNSMNVLESVFERFMNHQQVGRLEIRDAINTARDSETALDDAILTHLNYKTQLAAFIGVDYLPRME